MLLTRRRAWATVAGALGLIAVAHGPQLSASPQANGAQASPPVPARVEFNRDVRPILSDKCYTCHGPGAQMATLRFDIEAEAKKALRGDRYAIVPNDPEHSVMLARVTATDPKLRMPQKGEPLTAREVDVLRRWIAQGATWQKHWALHPAGAAGRCRRCATPSGRAIPIDALRARTAGAGRTASRRPRRTRPRSFAAYRST